MWEHFYLRMIRLSTAYQRLCFEILISIGIDGDILLILTRNVWPFFLVGHNVQKSYHQSICSSVKYNLNTTKAQFIKQEKTYDLSIELQLLASSMLPWTLSKIYWGSKWCCADKFSHWKIFYTHTRCQNRFRQSFSYGKSEKISLNILNCSQQILKRKAVERN